jgi:formylmethanofuran dehydrogenase subunit E
MRVCELSDLPEDQCACRIHEKPQLRLQPIVIVACFDARFDSNCDECGEQIHEGDPIVRTQDGEYICPDCVS